MKSIEEDCISNNYDRLFDLIHKGVILNGIVGQKSIKISYSYQYQQYNFDFVQFHDTEIYSKEFFISFCRIAKIYFFDIDIK